MTKAAGSPLGIDHRVAYDDSGIWGKAHQNQALIGTAMFAVGRVKTREHWQTDVLAG